MAAPIQHPDQKFDAPIGAPQQQYVAPLQQPQYGAQPQVDVTNNGAAPVTAHPAKSGPIDNSDIELWKKQFNAALVDPAATIKGSSPADSQEWDSSFCGCCSPIDACCMTYCCPCITFGKTHHRLNKSTTMQDYSPVNTSCLMFLGAGCFGLHWVLEALQRSQVRAKYNLKGSFLKDVAAACCCILCDLTQQEKESKFREAQILTGGAAAKVEQYKAQENRMEYEQKV